MFGRNGSGKQLLDRLLVGELVLEAGSINRKIAVADIALISFESQQAVYEHERRLAASDLLSDDESGTRVADFLPAGTLMKRLCRIHSGRKKAMLKGCLWAVNCRPHKTPIWHLLL